MSFYIKTAIAGFALAALTGTAAFIQKNVCIDETQYRVMFYNVENFFDIHDDSLTVDEAFTPSGDMHWTYNRYQKKLINIYKVIIAAGGWTPPDIVGLCEIENRQVLNDLINSTPLSKYDYRIVHNNSCDRRGIDVALIYNSQTVRYLYSRYYSIHKPGLLTRDILYCKVLLQTDTCHIFVNHWPSRSAGQLETEPDRLAAAQLLKSLTDSLFDIRTSAKILIMGDFNDSPTDESLVAQLKVHACDKIPIAGEIYNLSKMPASGAIKGTLKFQGKWDIFDQIIVSGSLLGLESGLSTDVSEFEIFREAFLLTVDESYNGYKPYRTYNGYKYQGGFSDHLPVYVDLITR